MSPKGVHGFDPDGKLATPSGATTHGVDLSFKDYLGNSNFDASLMRVSITNSVGDTRQYNVDVTTPSSFYFEPQIDRHGPFEMKIDVSLSNSLGFGGHNATLIFRKLK